MPGRLLSEFWTTPMRNRVELGSMGGSPDYVLQRMKSLVDTFSQIMDVNFELINSRSGSTDCKTFFKVPFADPEAYLICEHEISHPFFGTDLALAEVFREKAVERLLRKAGIPLTHPDAIPYKRKLGSIVHNLWNVLDDKRVCSLWKELYYGGGCALEERWQQIAEYEMGDQAKNDIITYLARLAAGVDTDDAPDHYQRCRPHMEKAVRLVKRVDNAACLAITSRLIDDIADELIKDSPMDNKSKQQKSQEKLDALASAIANPGNEGIGYGDNMNNPLGGNDIDPQTRGKGKERITAKQMGQIRRIQTARDDDGDADNSSSLQKLLDEGTTKMLDRLEEARAAMANPKTTEKQQREQALLSAAQISGIPASFVTPKKELPRPSRSAARLRKHLDRVKMKKETRRVWRGGAICIDSFISAKISRTLSSTKLFKETRSSGGMDLLLLVDVSASMGGMGEDLMEQAIADIQFAIKGAGSSIRLHLWAYSSELYYFRKLGSTKYAEGIKMATTHTVQALDAAWEWAKPNKNSRAVILITDGCATTCRSRKSSGNPATDTLEVLKDMRSTGVVVSILAIGAGNAEYYDKNFGEKGYGLVGNLSQMSDALLDSCRILMEAHLKS